MRLVIFTYDNFFPNIMTEHLLKTFPEQVVGVVCSDSVYNGRSMPATLLYIIKERVAPRFVLQKGLETIQNQVAGVFLPLFGKTPQVNTLGNIQHKYQVPVIGATDVNHPDTIQQIKAWQPDLILSIYFTQRIKADLIKLPSKGILNIHPSLLPRHRGLFPYFWVIAAGDSETGVTIHWIGNEKFDVGDVFLQEKIKLVSPETILSLSYKSAKLGADMLVKAINLVAAGSSPHKSQDNSNASYHSWPKQADHRRFRENGGEYGSIFDFWKYLLRNGKMKK